MEITEMDVDHVASLAHLELDEIDKKAFAGHFKKILSYMGKLNELDTTGIGPTLHVLPIQNVFRDDLTKEFFNKNSIQNVPQFNKDHYQVPKIIE